MSAPTAAKCSINGVDCGQLSDNDQTRMRRMEVGFVYQFHHLLPEFSALENVMLPQLILGQSRAQADARAKDLLGSLGLAERWDHRPAQLSGGEQQRVAIARAVANGPKLLLADEPTGNLDPHTAELVFEQLLKLVRQSGVAAVVATHNLDLAARMDRTLRLADGLLVEEEVVVATLAQASGWSSKRLAFCRFLREHKGNSNARARVWRECVERLDSPLFSFD